MEQTSLPNILAGDARCVAWSRQPWMLLDVNISAGLFLWLLLWRQLFWRTKKLNMDMKSCYGCLTAWMKYYAGYVVFYSYMFFQWLHSSQDIVIAIIKQPSLLRDGLERDGHVCPPWLCLLTVLSLFASAGTLLIAGIHCTRHMATMHRLKHGQLAASDQRNSLLVVIGLPVVYAMASFRSVVYFWGLYADESWNGGEWEVEKQLAIRSYDTVSGVADLYESYAMYQFVDLSLSEIRRTLNNKLQPAKDEEPSKVHTLLMDVLSSLTMLGVYSFILTCFLSALFEILAQNYVWLLQTNIGCDTLDWMKKGSSFFYAMGWATSSLAIVNVVQVETKFNEYITEFHAYKKFLSTKVMVSVTFMQSAALSLAATVIDEPQASFLYCLLLIFEVLILACYNLWAWPANEEWLKVSQSPIVLNSRSSLTGRRSSLTGRTRFETADADLESLLRVHNDVDEDAHDNRNLWLLKMKCACPSLAKAKNIICWKLLQKMRRKTADADSEAVRISSWPQFSPTKKVQPKRMSWCWEAVRVAYSRCCCCCKRSATSQSSEQDAPWTSFSTPDTALLGDDALCRYNSGPADVNF